LGGFGGKGIFPFSGESSLEECSSSEYPFLSGFRYDDLLTASSLLRNAYRGYFILQTIALGSVRASSSAITPDPWNLLPFEIKALL
jgi:hypothetical protein